MATDGETRVLQKTARQPLVCFAKHPLRAICPVSFAPEPPAGLSSPLRLATLPISSRRLQE